MSNDNGRNNWNVPFSIIRFFENALKGHSKIRSFERTSDILFHIELHGGESFHTLLVNQYTISEADLYRANSEFPGIAFLVTGANWNAYTREAKETGKRMGIGVFNSSEFFGALHWDNPIDYHQKDRDGNPTYAYRG